MAERQASDSDRLPWLEPYREPVGPRLRSVDQKPKPAKAPKVAKPSSGGRGAYVFGAVGGLALATLVGLIGYGLGKGEQATPPSVTAPIAPAPVAPERPKLDYPDIVDGGAPAAFASVTKEMPATPTTRPSPRKVVVLKPTPVKVAAAPAVDTPPPPPTAAPPVPKPRVAVPASPPPSAGQAGEVVRVGYFISQRHAEAAYRRAKARYAYVGTLPKVVAPVEMQGRGTVYALRLGAGSKANAKNTCRYMKRVAITCTVE